MIEASYYEKLKDNVQCSLCPWNCKISDGKYGNCKARKNIGNKLYSMVYAKPVSVNVDPIEKKPLYHFLPGSSSFSIGTAGCNLHCKHCQNCDISQANAEELPSYELEPEDAVKRAIASKCQSLSYTYNEPTVFFEYAYDTAKIAKQKGLKNVIVSNGFINEDPLIEFCKVIDAANIDLKGNDQFYRKITTGWIEPVLNTLKILHEKKVWFEITNLIIPTLNDDPKEIEKMCKWILDNLGSEYPLHFSAFYPCYKLMHLPRTSPETLFKAKEIAKKTGLNFVYIGNVMEKEAGNTYCPKCKKLLISRGWFSVEENNLINGKCSCGKEIPGVFNQKHN